eukprot:5704151-Amphidinium_carterae.1
MKLVLQVVPRFCQRVGRRFPAGSLLGNQPMRARYHFASIASGSEAEVVTLAAWAMPPNSLLSGPSLGSHRSR